jgi:predicted ATPase with chaperone activity
VSGEPKPEGVPGCWVPAPCRINAHATLQPSQKTGSPRVFCEHFVLIGAQNPCPCGWYGDPVRECTCSNAMVSRYQKRVSGPPPGPHRHAARIEVPRVEYEKLSDDRLGEPSAAIRARVEAARARQVRRFQGTSLLSNADALAQQGLRRPRCGSTAGSTMRGGACCGRR